MCFQLTGELVFYFIYKGVEILFKRVSMLSGADHFL